MSPRAVKPRRCVGEFKSGVYKPAGMPMNKLERSVMYRDELEAIRLCDGEGLTQEDAGQRMGVSRGTVQRILTRARKKVADAFSNCRAIVFEDKIMRNGGCDEGMFSGKRGKRV